MICIRFSVEGQEWWDSNNGMNYQFNFKQNSPRKTRHSLPPMAKIGSNFAHEHSLPGLRQGGFAPSSRIAHQFGGARSSAYASSSRGPRDWNFPVAGRGTGSGANSPALSPPPATAFKPPALPDVHHHLTLKNHCAPSPPKSPPTSSSELGNTALTLQTTSEIVGSDGSAAGTPAHERRSSWAGKVEKWESFSQVLNEDSDHYASTDGSSTPLATRSQSASVEDMSDSVSSPSPNRALTMKRSTGDLQALRNGGGGLTPPSSHDSSPSPLQHTVALPETEDVEGAPPMSPDPSLTSTGESSPIDTLASDSTADLANLTLDDPSTSVNHLLNDASYQEFINRFCFFQSPSLAMEELPPVRKNYTHVSGHASPAGFPFYGSHGSQSQSGSQSSIQSTSTTSSTSARGNENDNLTPKQEYDSVKDAFNIPAKQDPATPRAMSRQGMLVDRTP